MPEQGQDGGITRRRFVRDASVATVAATDLLAAPAPAVLRKRPGKRRQTVAVFGGGIAGLTAAHELVERGFDVTVYERRAWGGKARSMDVPGTGRSGRRPLPAEHGFREVFANYQNLPDTMRRIPFGSSPGGVHDNLVGVRTTFFLARDGGRTPFVLPGNVAAEGAPTPAEGVDTLVACLQWLPPSDLARVVNRLVVFLSGGLERKYGQWEYQRWADFVQEDRLSEGARRALVDFPTRFAAQTLAGDTSARTIGQAFESIFYPEMTGRGVTRVLDAPTNEAWIGPWLAHLRSLGVRLRLGHRVTALGMRGGRISHAVVRDARGKRTVRADWYFVALPVDWATRLWNKAIVAAEPQLARSFNITGGWMTGIQLYLRSPTPITRGPLACLDSPWAIAGISQAQFWEGRDFSAEYGDGSVHDKFSAVIVDWDTPGILFGKPARQCTRDEIAAETWAQFKRHFTYAGATPMPDSLLAGTYLDPGMRFKRGRIIGYDDPLPRCNPGTWDDRPDAAGRIPNLFHAGDHVKVDFDITSMEGASEAARRATNELLERAGSREQYVRVFERYLPDEWAPLRALDDERYKRGQPNLFDAELTARETRDLLRTSAKG